MGAQNATLTFMVGGTSDEFERVKGFLEGMGKKITHCGSIGMGMEFILLLHTINFELNENSIMLLIRRSSKTLQQHDVGYQYDWHG